MYFVPYDDGTSFHGKVLRYDTTGSNGSFKLLANQGGIQGISDSHLGTNFVMNTTDQAYNLCSYEYLDNDVANHIVVTYDHSNLKLYINNSLVDSVSCSADMVDSSADVIMGLFEKWGFDGTEDEIKIYTKAIPSTEVTALYNSGKWRIDGNRLIDLSVSKLGGTLVGGTLVTKNGFEFDGTGDSVTIGNTGTDIRSLSFWVNMNSTTESILETTSTVGIFSTSGTLSYGVWDNAYVDGVVSTTIGTGWHHIVVTSTTDVNCSAVSLGKINTTYYTGYIDDFQVWSRELSAGEIKKLYYDNSKNNNT